MSLQAGGQKGLRRESRKRMKPLGWNFGLCLPKVRSRLPRDHTQGKGERIVE